MKRKMHLGNQYSFLIELNTRGKYCLDIWAKHKATNVVSPIANINPLISELQSQDDKSNLELFYESSWIFQDKIKAIKIYNKLLILLNDGYFLTYLEKKLDEDRILGGWNSEYSF